METCAAANFHHSSDTTFKREFARWSQEGQPLEIHLPEDSPWPEDFNFPAPIRRLDIKGTRAHHSIALTNRQIRLVRIGSGDVDVSINHCKIEELRLRYGPSVIVSNSVIGELIFEDGGAVRSLEIRDSAIVRFAVPAANPFKSAVLFKNVFFPRDDDGGGAEQLHQIRRARAYLIESHNTLAASVLHSVELARDRPSEPVVSRVASYFYEVLADYGNSMTRPATWFIAIYALIASLVFLFDPVVASSDRELYFGWQRTLQTSAFVRAFVYPATAVFNPFGVFSAKSILAAASPAWAIIFQVLGLFGTAAAALFFVSLRRRFKLDAGPR